MNNSLTSLFPTEVTMTQPSLHPKETLTWGAQRRPRCPLGVVRARAALSAPSSDLGLYQSKPAWRGFCFGSQRCKIRSFRALQFKLSLQLLLTVPQEGKDLFSAFTAVLICAPPLRKRVWSSGVSGPALVQKGEELLSASSRQPRRGPPRACSRCSRDGCFSLCFDIVLTW